MIDIIEQIVLILIHECWGQIGWILEILICFWCCTQEFSHIISVLRCIHDTGLVRYQFKSTISTNIDSGYQTLTTLSIDQNYAISTFRTIQSCSVLQDLNILNIFCVNNIKHIVHKAIMKCRTVILHIPNNAIYHYQWLRYSIQRVQTINEHSSTLCRHSSSADSTHR